MRHIYLTFSRPTVARASLLSALDLTTQHVNAGIEYPSERDAAGLAVAPDEFLELCKLGIGQSSADGVAVARGVVLAFASLDLAWDGRGHLLHFPSMPDGANHVPAVSDWRWALLMRLASVGVAPQVAM